MASARAFITVSYASTCALEQECTLQERIARDLGEAITGTIACTRLIERERTRVGRKAWLPPFAMRGKEGDDGIQQAVRLAVDIQWASTVSTVVSLFVSSFVSSVVSSISQTPEQLMLLPCSTHPREVVEQHPAERSTPHDCSLDCTHTASRRYPLTMFPVFVQPPSRFASKHCHSNLIVLMFDIALIMLARDSMRCVDRNAE